MADFSKTIETLLAEAAKRAKVSRASALEMITDVAGCAAAWRVDPQTADVSQLIAKVDGLSRADRDKFCADIADSDDGDADYEVWRHVRNTVLMQLVRYHG